KRGTESGLAPDHPSLSVSAARTGIRSCARTRSNLSSGHTLFSREELVRALRRAGFEGPYSGGRHGIMLRGRQRLVLPNPHAAAIGRQLLERILRQAGS